LLAGAARAADAPVVSPEECAENGGDRLCTDPMIGPWRYTVCENVYHYPGRAAAWCAVGGGSYAEGLCTGDAPMRDEADMVTRAKHFEAYHRTACEVSAQWSGWGVPVPAELCRHPGRVFKGEIEVSTASVINTAGVAQYNHDTCDTPFTETLYGMRDRSVRCPAPYVERISARGTVECVQPKCLLSACAQVCSRDSFAVNTPAYEVAGEVRGLAAKCKGGVLDGEQGFSLRIEGKGMTTQATCSNGCKTEESFSTSGDAAISVCGMKGPPRSLRAGGTGRVDRKVTYATVCEPVSCTTVCDANRSCTDETSRWSAGASVKWNATANPAKAFAGGRFAVGAFCHGEVELQGGVSYERKATINSGYPGRCDDCQVEEHGLKLGGSAKGACALHVRTGLPGSGAEKVLVDQYRDGLGIEYEQEILGRRKSGRCGDEICFTSRVGAKATVDLSTPCLSLGGRGVKLGLKGTLGGKCDGSSCDNSRTGDDGVCTADRDFVTVVFGTCK
jgi:hypothetical protein